jgi:hypothetical protein
MGLLQHLIKQADSELTKPTNKVIQRALLMADDSYATALFLVVMDQYGVEALNWSPETIRMELEQDYSCKLPKENLDKIMAAITIVSTNYFYKDVTRFIELCNIFSGDDFQPDEFEPADTGEILWGITEGLLLWPPDDDPEDTEFSAEIREYIRQVLNRDGILKPFDVLRLALSGDQSNKVDVEYADDPEMYSAIYSSQQGKTDGLKQVYLENVAALGEQLKVLPLKNGSTQEALRQLNELVQNAGIER